MLALGVSVEGCSEYMTPLMGQVWPVIEAGLQDNDAGVRRATCVAVSCLCEWLEDECVSRHAVLVPVRDFSIVGSKMNVFDFICVGDHGTRRRSHNPAVCVYCT
jgi:hypothetical protein